MRNKPKRVEVIVIGAGLAGVSAAIYLGRARRRTLVIHEGKSMARWEPDVQNYLGFPGGIDGSELLRRGRRQARRYGVEFVRDRVMSATRSNNRFCLKGQKNFYSADRVLIATGIFHLPPEIPGVEQCLGHSMFFCKDCDGYRVRGQRVAIYGWTNEAVEYALGLLLYSPLVLIVTDGRKPAWDKEHGKWVKEYKIPVHCPQILRVRHHAHQVEAFCFADGTEASVDALFTTRGDVYFNELARELGARVNQAGEILVDEDMRTNVAGLYAAGCVTPANCQMVIAAGQGATAAQAMNRDLLLAGIRHHHLRRYRWRQIRENGACLEPLRKRSGPFKPR